jgi:hypothetical protein
MCRGTETKYLPSPLPTHHTHIQTNKYFKGYPPMYIPTVAVCSCIILPNNYISNKFSAWPQFQYQTCLGRLLKTRRAVSAALEVWWSGTNRATLCPGTNSKTATVTLNPIRPSSFILPWIIIIIVTRRKYIKYIIVTKK